MAGSLQILGELLRNLGLLAIVVVGQTIVGQATASRWGRQLLIGILFGAGALAAMSTPVHLAPGVILDVRNVVVALAGPCGGALAALLTVASAGLYRAHLGGAGALPGVMGIIAATSVGLLFHIAKPGLERWSRRRFLALGVTVSAVACSSFLLLGPATAVPLLQRVGLPLAVATTLGVVLLGCLLREAEQRQRALQSLSASAERFATLFHSAFNYLLLLDRDGRVLQANETALRVAGFPQQDLGREIWTSGWWADHQCKEKLRELVRRAAEGELVRAQASIRGGQGGRVDVSLKPSQAIAGCEESIEGCEQYLLLEARDITELLEQQEQLHRSERLRALGQLISGVTHEFNNLLLLISSNAELLQQRIADREGREAARRLAQVVRQARDLTHRLLCFSRRQQLAPLSVEVGEVVRSTIELTRTLVPDALRLELRAEAPVRARIDPHQLELALVNLILNARDAIAAEGTVSIEVSLEVVYAEEARRLGIEPGAYASLIVGDTGAGMTSEIAAKAFEPFFTTKPVGQGTGLGLSMVHGFVLQSGGHVSLESEPGVGTAIRLLLPCEPSRAATRPRPEEGETDERERLSA